MIFYFSGTGNTRWLAHELGEALGERVIDITQVVDDGATYRLSEGERLGFCFPVHGWRPPFLFRNFVRRLTVEHAEGHYVYAFATCGDDVGRTFEYFEDDLLTIGLRPDSVFSLIMPESYLFPFVETLDPPERAILKQQQAKKDLQDILPYIYNKVKGIRRVNESRWPRTNSHLLGAFFLHCWVTDKPFSVDKKRCTRCGRCQKTCAVSNIGRTDDGYPAWLHNQRCTTCFACYHHCSAHAIRYGTRTAPSRRQYYFEKLSSKKTSSSELPAPSDYSEFQKDKK